MTFRRHAVDRESRLDLLGWPVAPTISPRRIRSLTNANFASSWYILWTRFDEQQTTSKRVLLEISHDLDLCRITVKIVEVKFRSRRTFRIDTSYNREKELGDLTAGQIYSTGHRDDIVVYFFILQMRIFLDEITQGDWNVKFVWIHRFTRLFHLLNMMHTHLVIFLDNGIGIRCHP